MTKKIIIIALIVIVSASCLTLISSNANDSDDYNFINETYGNISNDTEQDINLTDDIDEKIVHASFINDPLNTTEDGDEHGHYHWHCGGCCMMNPRYYLYELTNQDFDVAYYWDEAINCGSGIWIASIFNYYTEEFLGYCWVVNRDHYYNPDFSSYLLEILPQSDSEYEEFISSIDGDLYSKWFSNINKTDSASNNTWVENSSSDTNEVQSDEYNETVSDSVEGNESDDGPYTIIKIQPPQIIPSIYISCGGIDSVSNNDILENPSGEDEAIDSNSSCCA